MNLILYCLLLISYPFSTDSYKTDLTGFQNYSVAENSGNTNFAMNYKTKLHFYETSNEHIQFYDTPNEPQLINVTRAAVPQNAPIANSLWLPSLSMLAGLFLWRIHVQKLQKKQSRINQDKD